MYKLLIVLILILPLHFSFGQKKQLDHTAFDDWNSISNTTISDNGVWVAYQAKPYKGNAQLVVVSAHDSSEYEVNRGYKFSFLPNNLGFVAQVTNDYDSIRKLKLDKVKKEKWPKDSLYIQLFEHDSLIVLPHCLSYQVSEENNVIAYLIDKDYNVKSTDKDKKKKCLFRRNKKDDLSIQSDGNELILLDLVTGKEQSFDHVTDYTLHKSGEYIAFLIHQKKDTSEFVQVHLLDLTTNEKRTSVDYLKANKMVFNHLGDQLAFLASNDTIKQDEHKKFELFLWNSNASSPEMIVDSNDTSKIFITSNHFTPYFSLDDKRLFFGKQYPTFPDEKDSLLPEERAKLDLWHYQDARLQPQQLKELKRDKKKHFLSVFELESEQVIRLENDSLRVQLYDKGRSDFALGIVSKNYESMRHWSYPWKNDFYRINITNGSTQKIKDSLAYSYGLSPSGRYFVYYDNFMRHWMYEDFDNDIKQCITCFVKDTSIVWVQDINGMPHAPRPFGIEGFTDNDRSVIIYSEHDIWEVDLVGNNASCITFEEGRNFNTTLRLKHFNKDSSYIDLSESIVHGVDEATKNERFYELSSNQRNRSLGLLVESPHKFVGLKKAKDTSLFIYQKMNVTDYPDLYHDNERFSTSKKCSEINPQQQEYVWPTVQQVSWTSYDNQKLDGLLYLPDNLDSSRQYPMIVYFYEMYSDRKHQHYVPKPTASIVFPTEYASAGYAVFIPDIRYKTGHPGQSAYDCIMSGTDYILANYSFIDSNRMGLQGQSWGGYQTAQLITMTNRYKAAMAGAPVSNMFSAYGGIRWSSGYNRQFQYERTQSRIGKTIWEAPELYVENSPLFGIPNIETPLLMMHNDNDGAVPWYQGIEMFMGMKRLNKPVWLLNYNGDEHNLMKDANREDLSIRMRQYFDYYLQEKPAPLWLKEGIPAIEKGKNYKLELE